MLFGDLKGPDCKLARDEADSSDLRSEMDRLRKENQELREHNERLKQIIENAKSLQAEAGRPHEANIGQIELDDLENATMRVLVRVAPEKCSSAHITFLIASLRNADRSFRYPTVTETQIESSLRRLKVKHHLAVFWAGAPGPGHWRLTWRGKGYAVRKGFDKP